jgi:hypothetical protein
MSEPKGVIPSKHEKEKDGSNLKCVICGKEAQYVLSGMSLCEEHFKAQQVGDKDIDLMKIQIYADKCHTFLTVRLSLCFVVLGLWAVFATVYYQGLSTFNFPFVYAGWIGMGVILVIALIASFVYWAMYFKDFRRISNMIEAVKKGASLPTLDKLDKWNC